MFVYFSIFAVIGELNSIFYTIHVKYVVRSKESRKYFDFDGFYCNKVQIWDSSGSKIKSDFKTLEELDNRK